MTTHLTSRRVPDPATAVAFLEVAYAPDDWIALLAKSHRTGAVVQRVRPRSWFTTARVQAWLRALNAQRWSHYMSINAVTPGQRSRRRQTVAHIRHVMLDVDGEGPMVLRRIADRRDVPPLSYVIHSSSARLHVLWRVTGFVCSQVEALQRHLARELATDGAATSCAQTTRLPGFANHKYQPPPLVTVEYRDLRTVYEPSAFPQPRADPPYEVTDKPRSRGDLSLDVRERARRYLAAMPPAIAGQHGDQHTFRVCCRMARGFALNDADALEVMAAWNARCDPPWTARELQAKLQHARRYGHEPIRGLVDSP